MKSGYTEGMGGVPERAASSVQVLKSPTWKFNNFTSLNTRKKDVISSRSGSKRMSGESMFKRKAEKMIMNTALKELKRRVESGA